MNKLKNRYCKWLRYIVFLVSVLGHIFLSKVLPVYINKGISFGIYFKGINILGLSFLGFILTRMAKKFDWGLWLVFVGGVINLGERVIFGGVSDYFNLGVVYNNLPDLLIFIGIIWYCANGYKTSSKI